MSEGTILFTIRNKPENLMVLFKDNSGIAIRMFNIKNDGQAAVRTLPITIEELDKLCEFVIGNDQFLRTK